MPWRERSVLAHTYVPVFGQCNARAFPAPHNTRERSVMFKHHLWKVIVAVVLAATLAAPGVSATSLVFQSPPPVPPPNDNFSDATVITGMSFSQSVDVTGATTEAGEPQGACCEAPQQTVWYAFTPLENGAASVSLWGNDSMNTNLNAYRADGPGLSGLSSSLGNARYGGGFTLNVQANQTYYFQAGTNWPSSNILYFSMSFLPTPANDNFANAKVIATLPYDDNTDMTAASIEAGEPMPSCSSTSKTIWYAYTPTASGSFSQRTDTWWPETVVAVYTGSSLSSLQQVACR